MAGLVLDFADAFNSISLAENERRFNCAHVGRNIVRSRGPLFDGEAQEGAFVVWRVLGFGGRPNPLVYARAASLASRSAQALLGRSSARSDLAETRLQLYVDDTVAALAGRRKAARQPSTYWSRGSWSWGCRSRGPKRRFRCSPIPTGGLASTFA